MELTALSLNELQSLESNVRGEIERRQELVRQETMAKIQVLAEQAGIDLSEVLSGPSRKRPKLPPKYRNPSEPNQTWSGRGKKPNWLVSALNTGASLEEFAIG